MGKVSKDWRPLLKACYEQGGIAVETKKKGYMIRNIKTGKAYVMHTTPSPGKRAIQNATADLRRIGVSI